MRAPRRAIPALPIPFLCLLLALLSPARARADARIAGFDVAVDGGQVEASVALADAFDRRLAERLESGLPTAILYRFELHRDRKRWYDRRLDAATLEAVAMYDAVERRYDLHFKLDGELVESRAVTDRAALEEAMTRIQGMPIFRLEGLPRRWRLLVKVRAELGSRTILSFIPAAITTDWAESRKFHAP